MVDWSGVRAASRLGTDNISNSAGRSPARASRAGFAGRSATLAGLLAAAALAGCSSASEDWRTEVAKAPMFPESKWGVAASERVASPAAPVQRGGGAYKVGKPYRVGDNWYNPREQPNYDRVGIASWYGSDFHARKTANGEIYNMHALTAAHPTLPMPSYAYVTNLATNRTIMVRINDRGPYVKNRLIDLSQAAAEALGLTETGTARVRVRYAGPAPLDGNDRRERQFLATGRDPAGPVLASAPPPAQPSQAAAQPYQSPAQPARGPLLTDWSRTSIADGETGAVPSPTLAVEEPQRAALPTAASPAPSTGGWDAATYRSIMSAQNR